MSTCLLRNTLIVVANNVPKATERVGSTTPLTVGRSSWTANKFPSTGWAAFWPLKKMAMASAIMGHNAKARMGGSTRDTNWARCRNSKSRSWARSRSRALLRRTALLAAADRGFRLCRSNDNLLVGVATSGVEKLRDEVKSGAMAESGSVESGSVHATASLASLRPKTLSCSSGDFRTAAPSFMSPAPNSVAF